ncbi:MAG: 3-oxoacyl-[acyl-carrier protein] reductase [Solirubrobacteraceae bacterium]|jgi:3-oxoacyl-[acyl-carrier protein] reductase|nr:3-oxoacyl-[acyl-carrier protein] reductase [Solirubrobacteraceae bacterium]
MDLQLTGKRALVTGATRGLGRAIAERLADEGCALAICARDADEVKRAIGELRDRGVTVHGTALDVTDAPALERFVAEAGETLGGLDLLVANAGGAAGGERLEDTDAEDWRTTFDLNVVHAAVAARAATPLMRTAGGGAMVFIASISGLRPQPRAQYAAAKAAEIHLAVSLARELGPDGIRVNALSPGSILFPGGGWERRQRSDPAAFEQWVRDEFPLGRLGTVDEVADVTCFLLSARASWISGTNVIVDGAQNQPGMAGW